MITAACIGCLSGLIGAVCWLFTQLIVHWPIVFSGVSEYWPYLPISLGCLAAVIHFKKNTRSDRQTLSEIIEYYHYGSTHLSSFEWALRGVLSFLSNLFGGIFGFSGGVAELSFSFYSLFTKTKHVLFEEKQVFAISILSSALAISLGAPLSSALIALELTQVVEAKIRVRAVVASLTSYGTILLFYSTVTSYLHIGAPLEHQTILGVLTTGIKRPEFSIFQWFLISLVAFGLGAIICLVTQAGVRLLVHSYGIVNDFIAQQMKQYYPIKMLLMGLAMSLTVWLVPESFQDPTKAWEDMAWVRLSSGAVLILLISRGVLFVLAFAGWGSLGVFTPILTFGAFIGYGLGNLIGSSWALPLAIASAVSALSSSFRIPLAASALVLEVTRDGPAWWLASLAVFASVLVAKFINYKPLQTLLLERHGFRILQGHSASVLSNIKVAAAMETHIHCISENSSFSELRQAVLKSSHNFLGILSTDGKYIGLFALETIPKRIQRVLHEKANTAEIQAIERVFDLKEMIVKNVPTVSSEDSLEYAFQHLRHFPCIAVINNEKQLCGLLFESSVTRRYKREITRL